LTAGFLLAGEWLTRAKFEAKVSSIMKSDASLHDIHKYYGNDKFLVATLGDEVIGVVGMQTKGKVGTVRYWHVRARYRERGLGWDLLEMVIERNQGTKKHPLQSVQIRTYNLQKRAEKTLKDHGFKRTGNDEKEPGVVGWFGVRTRMWVKQL
jgi:N-acetylglutamate synthase-like GNAT family acetyltransferase